MSETKQVYIYEQKQINKTIEELVMLSQEEDNTYG